MKRTLLTLTMLLTATYLYAAQDNTAAVEREIKQLIATMDQAMVKADTATLKKILTDDFTFVNPGGFVVTRERLLSAVEGGKMVYEEHRTDDIKLRVFTDTAVAQGLLTMRVPVNGQTREVQARLTIVLTKAKEQWQVFTLHSSAIPPPRPPQQPTAPPAPIKPPSEL